MNQPHSDLEDFEFFMPPKKGEGAHGVGILPGKEVRLTHHFDRPSRVTTIENVQEHEGIFVRDITVGIDSQVSGGVMPLAAFRGAHVAGIQIAFAGQALGIVLKNESDTIRVVCLKISGIRAKEKTVLSVEGRAYTVKEGALVPSKLGVDDASNVPPIPLKS